MWLSAQCITYSVHVYNMYSIHVCVLFQLIENEAEVLSHSQQLAALSAELAQERETLEEVETLEGQPD